MNIEGKILLTDVFARFTRIYWYLIVKHKLRQSTKATRGGKASVNIIFDKYIASYRELIDSNYDSMDENIKINIEKDVYNECKKYVVGAFYGDTEGIVYSFSIKDNYIKFNTGVLIFMQKYSIALLKINYFEWISFLKKNNIAENCYSVATKLNEESKRTSLTMYKNFLYYNIDNGKARCFYCDKAIAYDKIHVDHFILWSFIKNDRLWNLVNSCPACNLNKSDKLTEKDFLDKIIDRDEKLVLKNDLLLIQDFSLYSKDRLINYYMQMNFVALKDGNLLDQREL